MVRPDDITFVPERDGTGIITRRYFRGSETLYCIRLPSGHRVHSSQPSSATFSAGLAGARGSPPPPRRRVPDRAALTTRRAAAPDTRADGGGAADDRIVRGAPPSGFGDYGLSARRRVRRSSRYVSAVTMWSAAPWLPRAGERGFDVRERGGEVAAAMLVHLGDLLPRSRVEPRAPLDGRLPEGAGGVPARAALLDGGQPQADALAAGARQARSSAMR